MLQDELVCGLNHEHIQQCLLSEGDILTLEKAIYIAHVMESAIWVGNLKIFFLKIKNVSSTTKRGTLCIGGKIPYVANVKIMKENVALEINTGA